MLERPIIEIAPKTWLISEYKLVNMYLLEGEETAMLIDTGVGLKGIPEAVQALTQKPLIVVITHGHPDHDGGACEFPEVYMHPMDIPFSEGAEPQLPKFREMYVRSRIPVRNPGADAQEILDQIIPGGPVVRKPLEAGYVFDLGGREVEVIHTPGHSWGSICLLDRNTRLLFNGDSCNGESLLLNCGPSSAPVSVYNRAMEALWARESEFDAILWGHDNLEKCDKTIIQDYIEASALLMRGEASGTEASDAMHSGCSFRHKRVLIWYDPNRLTE